MTLLDLLISGAHQLQKVTIVDFQSGFHPTLASIILYSPSLEQLCLDNVEWAVYPDFPSMVSSAARLRELVCRRSPKYWSYTYTSGPLLYYAFRTERAIFHEMYGLDQLICMHTGTLVALTVPLESFPLRHFHSSTFRLSKIVTLSLFGESTKATPTIAEVCTKFPNLQSLVLEKIEERMDGIVDNTPWIDASKDQESGHLLATASNLSVLSVAHFHHSDPILRFLPPKLRTLSLLHDYSFFGMGPRNVVKNHQNGLTGEKVIALLVLNPTTFMHLRYFSFALCNTEVTASLLSTIAHSCQNLERLDINHTIFLYFDIINLGLLSMHLNKLSSLHFLCINGPWEQERPHSDASFVGQFSPTEKDWLEYLRDHAALPLQQEIPSLWRVSFFAHEVQFISFHLRPESYNAALSHVLIQNSPHCRTWNMHSLLT